jgi:hypothetical protein
MDTYKSQVDAAADKAQQQRLLAALNGAANALRRDYSGAWTINGSRGHVYTWGDGKSWVLVLHGDPYILRSKKKWTWIKRALSFCEVTQDGDEEGCLRLFDLPDPDQAEAIRDALGISQTRPPPANAFESGWMATI